MNKQKRLLESFAMRDVATVYFFDIVTGELVTTLDTLKTSGIEFTSEPVYVRGGVGNQKLVVFSGTKDGKVTLQDAIFGLDSMGIQTGNEAEVGEAKILMREQVKVASDGATISKTPVGDIVSVHSSELGEMVKGDPATNAGEYSVADKAITFHAGDLEDGKTVTVAYFANVSKSVKTKISANATVKSYKVVMESTVVDPDTKETYMAQIMLPAARPDETFNLALTAEGDPAVHDINLEILKPSDSDELFEMVIFDEKDVQ